MDVKQGSISGLTKHPADGDIYFEKQDGVAAPLLLVPVLLLAEHKKPPMVKLRLFSFSFFSFYR
jgi:hypothetical protein